MVFRAEYGRIVIGSAKPGMVLGAWVTYSLRLLRQATSIVCVDQIYIRYHKNILKQSRFSHCHTVGEGNNPKGN